MACRLCQLEIGADICEVCRYLNDETAPSALEAVCGYCDAPIAGGDSSAIFCQACAAMLDTIRSKDWFVRAQVEWEQENMQLARRKAEMLGKNGPPVL